MKIPLVSQSVLGGSNSSFLKSTSSILSTYSKTGALGGAARINLGNSIEDAVAAKLGEQSEDVKKVNEDGDRGIRIRGYLGSALKEIGRLSKQIGQIQDRITANEGNPEQKSLLEEQLGTLTKELERVVQSEPFTQALDTARALESALQNGRISRRSLQSVTSLLGDDFANLVAAGSLSSVRKITSGLSSLQELNAEELLADPGSARRAGTLSGELLSSLRSSKAPVETKQPEKVEEPVAYIEAPELSETSFQAAGEVALSLRTYQGKDLLRAVASGSVENADDLFQLIIEPPKPDDDEEDKAEELESEREDEQVARKNGLNVEDISASDDPEVIEGE